MSLKRDLRFSEQKFYIPFANYSNVPTIDNIIYKTDKPEHKWIEESTMIIGDWRNSFRSTYIRWAISINGLHVASEKYKDDTWKSENAFIVYCFGKEDIKELVRWGGDEASKNHLDTVNMLASYGIIDFCSLFEEFIFTYYKVYLKHNPKNFLKGSENKLLRKLFKNKHNNPKEWEDAWNNRLEIWQRKRLYGGLDRVFLSYFSITGCKKPKSYKDTSPETWAETIKMMFLIRNCLVHNGTVVSAELAEISNKKYGLGFNFTTGQKLELSTEHLMSVHLFSEQLLSALNLSLIEAVKE